MLLRTGRILCAKTVNVIRNYEEGKENDISRKEDKNGSTDIKHDSVISSYNITTLFLPIVNTLKENPDFGWIFADPVDPEELGKFKNNLAICLYVP